jgi:hypothetical protein
MKNINMSFLWGAFLLIIFCFSSGELFGMEIVANDGAQGDMFGYAFAISGDYAIVGAYQNSENNIKSGAVYIFKRDGDTWVQMQKLVADDAENIDYFGIAVSISGNYVIVGATYKICDSVRTGAAYIFKQTDDIVMEPKAEIQNVLMNQSLPENSQSVWITVQAIAGANPISSVFVQIIPPQAFIENSQETVHSPKVSLTYHQELNQYKGLLNDLYKPGIYKIVIFAQDTQKMLSNTVIYSVCAPGIYSLGDLNYDRQINVDDVIMALKIVSNIQAEIKIDQKKGLTEVIDLLKQAGKFLV